MIIGITTRRIDEDGTRKVFVNEDYLSLLKRYNLTPIIIPYNIEVSDELLSLCDGFLIPGGDDIDASYYHKENLDSCVLADSRVDTLDFKVLDYALKSNKPVLGICRGLQLINIKLGGDLIVDIKEGNHKKKLDALLDIEKDSFIKGKDQFIINSFHHQGIDKLGASLKVEGRSEGMIELVTSKQYKLIASQFHIEQMDSELVDLIMNYYLNLFQKN